MSSAHEKTFTGTVDLVGLSPRGQTLETRSVKASVLRRARAFANKKPNARVGRANSETNSTKTLIVITVKVTWRE
jgi:hypothetical protein